MYSYCATLFMCAHKHNAVLATEKYYRRRRGRIRLVVACIYSNIIISVDCKGVRVYVYDVREKQAFIIIIIMITTTASCRDVICMSKGQKPTSSTTRGVYII